jgi:nitrate reductase beta subunit
VVKYRSRAQIANEQEELAIAGEYDKQLNVKKLAELLREGDMKEFYKIANKVLMIRTSNPVVRRLRIGNEGEEEIIEDRVLVEEEISKYFKTIYKRPERSANINGEDEEMKGDISSSESMNIDTSSEIFRFTDITEAVKCSNFNKGLGPDCFDGNILKAN